MDDASSGLRFHLRQGYGGQARMPAPPFRGCPRKSGSALKHLKSQQHSRVPQANTPTVKVNSINIMESILLISLCAMISPILIIAMAAVVISAPFWIFGVLFAGLRMLQSLVRR